VTSVASEMIGDYYISLNRKSLRCSETKGNKGFSNQDLVHGIIGTFAIVRLLSGLKALFFNDHRGVSLNEGRQINERTGDKIEEITYS